MGESMSQIFDALQRAETDREGGEPAVPLQAAEVLRRAERLAATKWETQARLSTAEGIRPEDLGAEKESDLEFPKETMVAQLPIEAARVEERSRILSQFRSLPFSVAPESRLVSVSDQDSAAAEAFRLLGVRLRDLSRSRPLKRVLVTSTIPREGKTTIAANLACTLARSTAQKVLLLEGDVRRPAVSEMLGLKGNPGICEWLRGDEKLTNCVYQVEDAGIWVMPAGSSPQNPLEVLQSPKLNALIAQLAEWFDMVIIDSPPVLPLADTSVWMRLADGIMLVARQGITEKKQLEKGLEAIDPQKLIGAIMNCSQNQAHSYYYY
jgi:capsular exopolysaccharide synthesis family protein